MYLQNQIDIIELLKENRSLIERMLMNFQKIENNKEAAMNSTDNCSTQKIKTKSS